MPSFHFLTAALSMEYEIFLSVAFKVKSDYILTELRCNINDDFANTF